MAPIPIRPPSRVRRNSLSPSPSSPSRLSAGIRQPLNSSSPVAEAWSPIFSSIRPNVNPGVPFSTMKAVIWESSSAAPVRATTM